MASIRLRAFRVVGSAFSGRGTVVLLFAVTTQMSLSLLASTRLHNGTTKGKSANMGECGTDNTRNAPNPAGFKVEQVASCDRWMQARLV